MNAKAARTISLLRKAADAIEASNMTLASEVLRAANAIEVSISKGTKVQATARLKALAIRLVKKPARNVPLPVLRRTAEAIVKTQTNLLLPAGTKLHRRRCCENGNCKPQEWSWCFTIDGTRGCLGTPCK